MEQKNGFFVRDKVFYRSLAAIALPIALQNIISFGVNIMDSVMLGSLGDVAISGASLGGQPFFILMMFSFGISSGGGVLIAQYWGKKNLGAVRRILSISMRLVIVVSLVFTAVSLLFPAQLMSLFSGEEAVVRASAQYLFVLAFSYPFFAVASNYMMSLRAVEQVKISAVIYGVSFFINIFFNYCFIFGKFGFPRMEVAGAALGTVIARASEFVMVMVYMNFFEKRVGFRLRDFKTFDRTLLPDYVRHALPVVGNEVLWGLGTAATNLIIGRIGSSFVAASSIANVMSQFCNVFIFGVANAAAVLTGKAIGEGRRDHAQQVAQTLWVLSFGVGAVSCVVLLLLRGPVLQIYNVLPETRAMAFEILTVLALLQISLAPDMTCIVGILRGGGDTHVGFWFDCGGLWLIGVPLGLITGLVLHLPAPIVFLCMKLDSPVKLTLSSVRMFSKRWIRNVTRAE